MDTAGRSPRPVRRPRRATLAASTAFLLQVLLDRDPNAQVWLAANRRRLSLEMQLALDEDLVELRMTAEEFRRFAVSDVGQTDNRTSDMARGSSHDEITTAEAARELAVSPRTVLRHIEQGLLDGRRVNARSVMVTRASVKALLEARRAA